MELFHNKIMVDFYKDNHYTELKDAEVFRERLNVMDQAAQYVGEYLSKDWVMRKVFRFNEEEIEAMNRDMKAEIESGEVNPDDHDDNAKE